MIIRLQSIIIELIWLALIELANRPFAYQQKDGCENFCVQESIPLIRIPNIQRNEGDYVADQNGAQAGIDRVLELHLAGEHG